MSTEERELALIDKVELRIALADSDGKLSTLLKTYLAPLLLKLSSDHQSVRNKVITVCRHLNTRLQSPAVQLPVAALLQQFKEQEAKLIRHFDLIYAQQGFQRLSGKEKNELVPVLIKGISSVIEDPGEQSGAQFFNLFLQALHHYEFPRKGSKDEDELRQSFELSDEDAKVLASWFERLILLELVRPSAAEVESRGLPGLTESESKFLKVFDRPGVWDPSASGGMSLKAAKLLVLKLLSTGAFNDDERFMPSLFASAHRDSNIADRGEDLLKHAIADVNVDDKKFVEKLFERYLGTSDRAAASPSLQIKILGVLQRSSISATFPNECLRIFEQGVIGAAQGREAEKLQTSIFTFTHFFLRHGKKTDLRHASPSIVVKMQQLIEAQGWPRPAAAQDLDARRTAYEMIGSCAKAGQQQDLALLDWLFQSLRDDSSGRDTALAIEHALAMMIDTFSFVYQGAQAPPQSGEDVEMTDQSSVVTIKDLSDILHRSIQDEDSTDTQGAGRRSTRYIAARFANRCLPYSNAIGRWIDILAAGGAPNEKMEVMEEGRKGLDPYWFSTLNSDRPDLWAKGGTAKGQLEVEFPDFGDLFQQVFAASAKLMPKSQAAFALFQRKHPHAVISAISYCWRVFVEEALESQSSALTIDAQWERRIENGVRENLDIRRAVKTYVAQLQDQDDTTTADAFDALLLLTFEAAVCNEGQGMKGSHELFVSMLSVLPRRYQSQAMSIFDIGRLLPAIKSNDALARSASAQAFGILSLLTGQTLYIEQLLNVAEDYQSAIGAGINHVNGAIVSAAFALSRIALSRNDDEELRSVLQRLHDAIYKILQKSKDQTLLEAAYVAVEQFSVFRVYELQLSLDNGVSKDIIDKLDERASAGNEKAIKAMGRFGVGLEEADGEDPDLEYLKQKLYKLHEVRDTNVQFAVGEALCCISCGWANTALQLDMDVDLHMPESDKTKTLQAVMTQVLADCKAPKPGLRRAAVIWLLCLVQFCGHLPEVKSQLRACQAAFGNSLSDRDHLVQEAASRGLGIVYEKGDKELRDDLVRDLMKSFSSDKANMSGKVDEDTVLFNPGALLTGDGDNSITTYKDILSLASEIGNPGLVYKFMSLAADNAVWTNRAAFANSGLQTILSDDAVGGFLAENPKLYAKLFRYRFDPNTNVRRSMTDIWNSLVKDSNAAIEKYFDPIMDDLLKHILAKEWRVREACCDAIADLVQGRQLITYEKYLTDVWTNCFRVLDDIKETVRVAAAKLARVLSQILVRNLEAGDSSLKSAEAMLKHVLPFLLSGDGIDSSAKEVKMFAISTILQIVEKAGPKAIRPSIPELVERLLALFSDLEDEAINYIHLNASQYKISEEKLDGLRLNAVRNSPVMQALDRCFDQADAATMTEIAPAIERAMKAAVGLPTKLACGNALVSLTLRHREMFKPYAARFLKLLEKYSLDRNDTASSTYAAASGYLCKLVTDKQILKLVDFAKKLWLEDEDEKHRAVSADIVRAISKQVPERFTSLSSDILPFVFVAKHDGQEHIKDINTKTWEDNVGSMAISLHLREITKLSLSLLDSPRWNIKHSAARSVAEAATFLGSGYDGISEDQAAQLWPALKQALEGKTWEGKEVVVEAFASFAEKLRPCEMREKIKGDVAKIAIREAKRQNKDYQQYAISTLGKVAASFLQVDKVNWHKEVLAVVEPVIDDMVSSYLDKMDVDGRDAYLEDKRREKTLCGCIEALEQSLQATGPDLVAQAASALQAISKTLPVRLRGVETSIFVSTAGIAGKLKSSSTSDSPALIAVQEELKTIISSHDPQSYVESVRTKRVDAVLKISEIPGLGKTVLDAAVVEAEMQKEPVKALQEVLRTARKNI